ncbi:MAG: GNAT family N-acetyltransferase, partial [Oscillospiraceae bacterium]|nr:GNAT family N-acetyltransferase [Oscillospiraceae bacterium]
FAVREDCRGSGIGSELLDELIGTLPHPICLEVEPPETEIAKRRIAFYERNGFSPAYEMATCGLRWQALVLSTEEFALAEVMRWHKELYGVEREDVVVPLGKNETPRPPYWMKK